jgi:V8-like Glu-specific endopeptidase
MDFISKMMGYARREIGGRVPPESFDQPPYNCVGAVNTNENSGTGFLIWFNLVLTAAHIVWDFKENTKKKDIQFKWGNPLSVYEIENIIIL